MKHLQIELFLDVVHNEDNKENEDKGLLSSKNKEFSSKIINKSTADKTRRNLTNCQANHQLLAKPRISLSDFSKKLFCIIKDAIDSAQLAGSNSHHRNRISFQLFMILSYLQFALRLRLLHFQIFDISLLIYQFHEFFQHFLLLLLNMSLDSIKRIQKFQTSNTYQTREDRKTNQQSPCDIVSLVFDYGETKRIGGYYPKASHDLIKGTYFSRNRQRSYRIQIKWNNTRHDSYGNTEDNSSSNEVGDIELYKLYGY